MTITIYTDGSCAPTNPGPGGWGAILESGTHRKEISGSFRHTTNQRMELTAVIEAIKCLKVKNVTLDIYSDSAYVVNSISKGWIDNWVKTNFKGKANVDLWKEFLTLRDNYTINMIWVKGHASNAGNNRCDELATAASNSKNNLNWAIDTWYESIT